MSDRVLAGLLILLGVGIFALVPMLATSWRMLGIASVPTGLLVGYVWADAIFADWDKSRMLSGIAAIVMTSGWIVGLSGASFRLIGRSRGWRLAVFPVPEAVAGAVAVALGLMFSSYYLGVF